MADAHQNSHQSSTPKPAAPKVTHHGPPIPFAEKIALFVLIIIVVFIAIWAINTFGAQQFKANLWGGFKSSFDALHIKQ